MVKDEYGIQIKFPNRKCTDCMWYPCMPNFEQFKCHFAIYGCRDYKTRKKK